MNSTERKKLEKKAASRGISENGGYVRHVLFCGQSGCCKNRDEAKAAMKILNKGAKKLRDDGIKIYVSEVECLKLWPERANRRDLSRRRLVWPRHARRGHVHRRGTFVRGRNRRRRDFRPQSAGRMNFLATKKREKREILSKNANNS